ncbi:Sensor histidine kinase, LytS family [Candidatus Arthromitus sp. SFB-mouse-NL]|uniref:sensor histidine kinase n=1 Tax=Candidatus Arthromitus sp. SFB-mouse-NL TaxID=1508644 RepID=UPI000499FBAC|nr:histidine kinase [Candidatus Arthromitus sp. SFB-mouse-NL]AID44779.1 Sensor histidine kinase, LytS family [Candidatus Arthromitus sp. SFB-mouse-NL]
MVENKSKVYKKIFWINTITVIFLMLTLDIYLMRYLISNVKESQLYINEKILNDVDNELEYIYNHSLRIVNDIYTDDFVVEDIIKFLNADTINYLTQKLDKLSLSNSSYHIGIEKFVRSSFMSNENLKEIGFVSFNMNTKSVFNRSNQINVTKVNKEDFYSDVGLLNILTDKNSISLLKEINDPINLETKGLMILTYNLEYLKKVLEKYDQKSNVLILNNIGYVVYDSDEKLGYEPYMYYEDVIHHDDDKKIMLNTLYYIKTYLNKDGLTVISMMESKNIENLYGSIALIIFIALSLIFLSQLIALFKIKNLGNRTNEILNAMDKVRHGNLDIEIPLTSDLDEINYIADNFNKMCKDLNTHIDKRYRAELELKKAEMISLQNQINPHFLYNTLESIRMKAICNGDKEVGKMLYILSVLFRNQLKDKNIITINTELKYCTKYVELFKFRYNDLFDFYIECDESLKDKGIPKFTLQPLIENYFIHGINFENSDNILKILISSINSDLILIKIIDNGIGIDEEKRNLINHKIQNDIYSNNNSMGIINVHKRILLEYGKGYGISLMTNDESENIVIIKIPCKGV